MTSNLSLPALHAPSGCAAALVPWRSPAGPRLTVVAKLTFSLAEGAALQQLPMLELVARDVHVERSPLRSLEDAAELAPAVPRAEIVVVGSAYAAQGLSAPAVTVELQVARGDVLLRKRAHVLGDRPAHGQPPQPFKSMPIAWERAAKGELNPIGVGPGTSAPNWIDPQDPARPVGLGPIPSLWPARRARRGDLKLKEGEPLDIPAGFDWTYFQCAPDDQQLDRLVGDEWLALDRLHPVLPRLAFQLPGRHLLARLVQASGTPLTSVELALDRVVVDTNRQRVTLLHRGAMAVDWTALSEGRAEVGIGLLGQPIAFPDAKDPATLRSAPVVAAPSVPMTGATVMANPEDVARPAVPFRGPAARDRPPLAFPVPTSSLTRPVPTTSSPRSPATMIHTGAPPPAAPATPFEAPAKPAGAPAPALPFAVPPSPLRPAPPSFVAPPPSPATAPIFEENDDPLGRTRMVDLSAAAPAATPFAPQADAPRAPQRSAPLEGLPFQADAPAEAPPQPVTAAPPAAESKRRGEKIPMRTDAPMQVANITWQLAPPQEQLIVIVKASFVLTSDAQAPLSDEPALPVGDVFADDELDGALVHASDFAVLKTRVDLLVEGHAYAPEGKPTTAMQVAVRLRGEKVRYERLLVVFGDRTWGRQMVALAPTDPAPFTAIPLSWERAFGGAGHRDNPAGVGFRGARAKDGAPRLPNFEIPSKLIKGPDDAPQPAGLGPIHPLWPARWGLIGTYDKAWFKTRWPYFAPDLDPGFFQAAPPAQQLDALDGDEEYELMGLHPTRGSLRGRLPAARARAFAQMTTAAGGAFVPIPLKLDTLTFEPDADRGHLVWRGRLDVSDDDAPEIEEIFVTMEPVRGAALTVAEAKARYEASLVEVDAPDVAPPTDVAEEPNVEALAADEEARAIEDRIAAHEAKVRAEAPDPPPGAPDPLPPVDVDAMAKVMREGGVAEEEIAELTAAMRPTTATDPPDAPPADLRAFVIARVAAGEPLGDLDLRGADLRDLDLSKQTLAGSDLTGARLDRAILAGADLGGARLERASFVGAAMPASKLDGADLTGSDLSGANLAGASLVGAEGMGARFVEADLRGCILDEATLGEGDWSRANAEGATGENVNLGGSTLDRARFVEAKLVAIRLYDCRAREAVFDRADLTNARVDSASFTACSFRDISAKDSIWERSELTTSTFQGADLVDASFAGATCLKTSFNEADLTNARLRKAKMIGATFVRANMMEAACDKVDFELADLRGANLHGAFIHKTSLKHAKTDHAIVTQSALGRKQP